MLGALLAGGLATAATVVGLSMALSRALDPQHLCETGFSTLVSCTHRWSSTMVVQGTPIFTTPPTATPATASGAQDTRKPGYVSVASWSVAHCPANSLARRLLCAAPSAPAQSASEDPVTSLPLPRPWFLKTAKNSPSIKSVHVETPLGLAAALGFYRAALRRSGWTENDGAVIEPDRAVIAFTTTDGPALLRLVQRDDRTIVDLSLRKPAAAEASILPKPGQARLMLGNATDDAAVITINEQAITLAARAGDRLANDADARTLPAGQQVDLLAGKFKVVLEVANGAAQSREFEVAADETWALLVGPAGVPLPVHLH
jgi:hypothetical protein